MSWMLTIVIAYFLLALTNFVDKFLIDKVVSSSRVYAVLISLMGGLVIVGAPWFLEWPGFWPVMLDLFAGGVFVFALWLMFEALRRGDASRITVIIGGLTPLFTIAWSIWVRKEIFTSSQVVGILLLLVGTFLIAAVQNYKGEKILYNKWAAMGFCVASAATYAVHFIAIKYAYDDQVFASAFIWRGIGGVIVALLFLIDTSTREQIFEVFFPKKTHSKEPVAFNKQALILSGQAFGAIGAIMQSYAISLTSVALINSMQGVQYAFLIIMGWNGTIFFPTVLQENISASALIQKAVAVVLVGIGLYYISM